MPDDLQTPEPSLRDSIAAAVDKVESAQPASEGVQPAEIPAKPAEPPEKLTAEQQAAKDRDEKGRFLPKGKEAAEKPAAVAAPPATGAPEAPVAAPAPAETVEPPAHWSQADKEALKKAPAEVQGWLLKRYKDMEADYTRKTQDIAHLRDYAPIDQMFQPYKVALSAQGLTPQALIQRWAAAEQQLSANPTATLAHFAKLYRVDPNQLVQAMQGGQKIPAELHPVMQELNALKSQVNGWQQAQQQQQFNSTRSEIDQFAAQTAADGSPAHPHFDEVLDDMVAMAGAEMQQGRKPDLQNLYERAVWANPATRQKQLEATALQAQQKQQAAAKEHAANSRRAGSSITGAPTPGQMPLPEPKSVREAVIAATNRVLQ